MSTPSALALSEIGSLPHQSPNEDETTSRVDDTENQPCLRGNIELAVNILEFLSDLPESPLDFLAIDVPDELASLYHLAEDLRCVRCGGKGHGVEVCPNPL